MSSIDPERLSRKDFFQRTFKPVSQEEPQNHTGSHHEEGSLTRRNFNKLALIIGTGISGLHFTTQKAFADEPVTQASDTLDQKPDILTQVADTIVSTTGLEAGELASVLLLNVYEAPVGTATTEDEMKLLSKANIEDIFNGSMTGAVYELFRWVPNWIFGRSSGDKWEVGIPVSVMFAMIGNSKYVPFEHGGKKPQYFSGGKMPIFPFVDGLLYWNILRDKGLPYSALAHSWKSLVTLSLGRTVARKSPRLADNFLSPLTEPFTIQDIRGNVIRRILGSFKG